MHQLFHPKGGTIPKPLSTAAAISTPHNKASPSTAALKGEAIMASFLWSVQQVADFSTLAVPVSAPAASLVALASARPRRLELAGLAASASRGEEKNIYIIYIFSQLLDSSS